MSFRLKKAGVDLLYHDENYVLVSKPSGLLSIQDRFQHDLPNLKQILQDEFGEIYTVHRLDKETSGIIAFAKNEKAHAHLNQQFTDARVRKIYWAFVEGTPPIEEGQIDMPILNDMQNSGRMLANKDGKEALTFFRLLENFGNISLLECFPQTGRTHQIRVHCHYLGCPLLVDTLYHQKDAFYLSSAKRGYRYGKFAEERPLISRLTLHAKSLSFQKIDGEELLVESDLPKDLRALYNQLKKI